MAYTSTSRIRPISTLIPTDFVRAIRPWPYGALGVTQPATEAAYQACLAAQSAYQTDLALWNKEKAVYDAAVKARDAKITAQVAAFAAAMSTYQNNRATWLKIKAAHDAWSSQMGSKYGDYAMRTAMVSAQYNMKVLSGTPPCVPSATHTKLANECYLYSNPVKGLGAFDWTQYDARAYACFGAALPVCTPDPVEPPKPGLEPVPPVIAMPPAPIPPIRPKPTAPAACVAPGPIVTAVPPRVPPAPIMVEAAPPVPAIVPAEMAPEPVVGTKAGGGLLVAGLLVLAVGGGIYLYTRRRPAKA